ncbi:MAG: hypothetical protein UY50_C0006G0036 [Parcubacteria group bacterium GW2011_GWA2_49_9]|nr:MAG: hypothetical protein UY50_C0006G0036 [Parcubacteria group bacterium GW2011_GWA2_49_9]
MHYSLDPRIVYDSQSTTIPLRHRLTSLLFRRGDDSDCAESLSAQFLLHRDFSVKYSLHPVTS